MKETKSISEYGYSFQIKFIVCLITDKLFLEQIVDILDEKYISNDAFRWITREIREYYNQYKNYYSCSNLNTFLTTEINFHNTLYRKEF